MVTDPFMIKQQQYQNCLKPQQILTDLMHISLKLNLLIAVNPDNRLHQFLIPESSVSAIYRVVLESTHASFLHTLQQQNQIMFVDCNLFGTTNPFFNFRSQQIALMIAIHQVHYVLLDISIKEIQQNLLLLQCLFSSCEFNASICTILKSLERFIQIDSFRHNGLVDCLIHYFPINILVIFQNFDLYSFFCNFVFNPLFFKFIKNRPYCFVKTSRNIKQINLPPYLFHQWKLSFETRNRVHINFNFINSSIVDTYHCIELQCIHDLTEQTWSNFILTTKRIHSNNFFFIFLRILFTHSITFKQSIIDMIRIATFLRLLLSFYWFLYHVHDYLLKVVQCDKFRCNPIPFVVVVILGKEQQFLFSYEARFHIFWNISKRVIDGNIEIAKPQKVCVLAYGNVTVVNTFDQFKHFLFFLILIYFVHHFLWHKSAQLRRSQIIEQINRGLRFQQQLFIERVSFLSFVNQNKDAFEFCFRKISHHTLKFLFISGLQHDKVEIRCVWLIYLEHVVTYNQLTIVFSHQSVIETQHTIWVGFGNYFGNERTLTMVKMKVVHQQQVTLKFMVFLTLKQVGSNEHQFQLFQFIPLQNLNFVFRLLIGTKEGPLQFSQTSNFLHLIYPKGRVLRNQYSCTFNFLMQYMHQSRHQIKRHISNPAKLFTFLQPITNLFNLFRNTHKSCWFLTTIF